jgi:hypothetical protein
MKNITITLDERTARWARVYAAKHDMSLSRMIAELLVRWMNEVGDYEHAMGQYLGRAATVLKRAGKNYPPRAALHDRSRLR